jgi:uncharacterized protein YhaN
MKLHRIDIRSFGAIEAFGAEDLENDSLIVVLGDNESGKSTFADFLATMMFGFAPPDRHEHPHAPWNGHALEGEAGFVLVDSRRFEVWRRLRHAAEGQLRMDGGEIHVGNRPLPFLGPVDRALYESLHTLYSGTLQPLDEATWRRIEERLLSGCHQPWLRPLREVEQLLDERAGRLWQVDGRGDTRSRRLALALRRLSREREQAFARARRLADLRELIAGRSWQIESTEAQLDEQRGRLRRAEVLRPVLVAVERIEELRRAADQQLPEDDFPQNVRDELEALRRAVDERETARERLAEDCDRLEKQSELTEDQTRLLEVRDELSALVDEIPTHRQDQVLLEDLTRQRGAQEVRFQERAPAVFRGALQERGREALARLDLGALQARIKAWQEACQLPIEARANVERAEEMAGLARSDLDVLPSPEAERRLRDREEQLRDLQAKENLLTGLQADIKAAKAKARAVASLMKLNRSAAFMLHGAGLVVCGLVLAATLVLGESSMWPTVAPVALVLLAVGGYAIQQRRRQPAQAPDEVRADALARECLKLRADLELQEYESFVGHLERAQQALAAIAQRPELARRLKSAEVRIEECRQKVTEAETARDHAATAVGELLQTLPMRADRLGSPGPDLYHDIHELRGLLLELTRLRNEYDAVSQRVTEREQLGATLAKRLAVEVSGPVMTAAGAWGEGLHKALSARRRADEALEQLPDVREQLDAVDQKLKVARSARDEFVERLKRLDEQGGRAESGIELIDEARRWRIQAHDAERELCARFPDWEQRLGEARTADEEGLLEDLETEVLVALAGAIEQLESGLSQLRSEREELLRERERLAGRRSLADLDGALAGLVERAERTARAHDRLALMRAIVAEADARYRERYQPAVLQRASELLAVITGGRWSRLDLERSGERRTLVVSGADGGHRRPVEPPLSGGLCRQVQAALRLALAEQMEGDEPLPIVLDEMTAGWDEQRTQAGLEMLAGLGEQRQVVLLTSRPELARQLERLADARLLTLPPPADPHPTPTEDTPSSTTPQVEAPPASEPQAVT